MAKCREIPCKYYIALGQCKKGREACHKKYCQHCDKYCPRARVRCVNKKKQYNEKMKRLWEDMKMCYFDAPDLQDVGKNAYCFVNAVSDFATHSKSLRRTASPFTADK